MKRLAILAICAVVGTALVAGSVSANLTGPSSVVHMKIHWDGSTKYTAEMAYALDKWNSLGKVQILPDTLLDIEEVHVSDVYKPDAYYLGLYTWHRYGVDTIQFNTALIDELGEQYRKSVVMHEWGHALGLGEESEPYNVMVPYPSQQTDLGLYDRVHYFTLYPH
ncbi:MAG: matrixin family metalloprotease [Mycobacterium leprae]